MTGMQTRPTHRHMDRVVLTTVGIAVGGTLGAELGLLIDPPILGIATGVAVGAGCGVLVSMSRLSPVVAYMLYGMASFFLLHFPYTVGQGVYVVVVGASLGIVAAKFPRAVAWPAMGALLGLAILLIPCQSYGRPLCEWLTGPKQLPFVVGIATCAWVVSMTIKTPAELVGTRDRRIPAWPWFIAAGILAFLVLCAISVNSRKPPL